MKSFNNMSSIRENFVILLVVYAIDLKPTEKEILLKASLYLMSNVIDIIDVIVVIE